MMHMITVVLPVCFFFIWFRWSMEQAFAAQLHRTGAVPRSSRCLWFLYLWASSVSAAARYLLEQRILLNM
jgi:hypothetical protein